MLTLIQGKACLQSLELRPLHKQFHPFVTSDLLVCKSVRDEMGDASQHTFRPKMHLPQPLLPGTKVRWMVLGKRWPSLFSLLTASRYLREQRLSAKGVKGVVLCPRHFPVMYFRDSRKLPVRFWACFPMQK